MPKRPRIRGKDLIQALRCAGFDVIRIKGSHHFLRHTDSRCTVVPVHAGETIGPGLLNKILRNTELEVKDLVVLLK